MPLYSMRITCTCYAAELFVHWSGLVTWKCGIFCELYIFNSDAGAYAVNLDLFIGLRSLRWHIALPLSLRFCQLIS